MKLPRRGRRIRVAREIPSTIGLMSTSSLAAPSRPTTSSASARESVTRSDRHQTHSSRSAPMPRTRQATSAESIRPTGDDGPLEPRWRSCRDELADHWRRRPCRSRGRAAARTGPPRPPRRCRRPWSSSRRNRPEADRHVERFAGSDVRRLGEVVRGRIGSEAGPLRDDSRQLPDLQLGGSSRSSGRARRSRRRSR